jgi:hypothetical protein
MARAPSTFDVSPMPGFSRLGAIGEDGMSSQALCDIPPSPLAEIRQWVDIPPPYGRIFDKAAKITLAASAVGTEIIAFAVPAGMLGVLRFFANQVGSVSDMAFVSFTLRLEDSPVTGYANIIGPKSPGLSSPDALVVPLLGGNRIAVVASNLSSSAIQSVAARIKGWFWQPSLKV